AACTSTRWLPTTTSPASASRLRSTQRWRRAPASSRRSAALRSNGGWPTNRRSWASGRSSVADDMTGVVAGTVDALVVTGGHPFEPEPFFAVFDSLDGVEWTGAGTPATGHDVVVFYDMPGLQFTRADPPVVLGQPTTAQRDVFHRLTDDGVGLVFLHHAVAGWPAWHEYAELVGGRFHYVPGELDGV
ncbi:unnamed protein product, partial [Phaeothamnion confervicola]